MTKPRVILDTNIYLSGIIFGGNSRHILDLIIQKRVKAITSAVILWEISEKLKRKFKWTQDKVLLAIKTIIKTTIIVKPKEKLKVVKADKSDNKIIEAAAESESDYIISGDKHLLMIKRYKKIKIISPVEFLSIYFKK
ncbi:MAG: putative toxin-antitoxin system toxin component, PIN family [Patescibacteria group bacterium]|mgnify:CR=1 FL=1